MKQKPELWPKKLIFKLRTNKDHTNKLYTWEEQTQYQIIVEAIQKF